MKIPEEDYGCLADMFPKEYRGRVDEFLDPRDPCFRANLYNREGLPAAPFRTDTREFVRYSDHTLSSIVK